MADDASTPSQSGRSEPVYVEPQTEPEEPATSYLTVAVIILLLALTVIWVVYKLKGGGTGGGRKTPASGTNPSGTPGPLDNPGDFGNFDRGTPGSAEDLAERRAAGRANSNAPAFTINLRPSRGAPALSQADRERTDVAVTALRALGPRLDVIRAVSGKYPPSGLSASGASNDTNCGNEALTAYMKNRPRFDELNLTTGDTDGDGRAEILDPWGNPYIYFSHEEYALAQHVSGIKAEVGEQGVAVAQQRLGEQDGGAVPPQGGRVGVFAEYDDPSGRLQAQLAADGTDVVGAYPSTTRFGVGAGLRYKINDWLDWDGQFDFDRRNNRPTHYVNYRASTGLTIYLNALKPKADPQR